MMVIKQLGKLALVPNYWCYSLTGISIAYRDASSRFGSVSGSVFLDELSCSGTESALLDCRARPLGLAECNTDQVAGVQCTGNPSQLLLKLAIPLSSLPFSFLKYYLGNWVGGGGGGVGVAYDNNNYINTN